MGRAIAAYFYGETFSVASLYCWRSFLLYSPFRSTWSNPSFILVALSKWRFYLCNWIKLMFSKGHFGGKRNSCWGLGKIGIASILDDWEETYMSCVVSSFSCMRSNIILNPYFVLFVLCLTGGITYNSLFFYLDATADVLKFTIFSFSSSTTLFRFCYNLLS